MQRTIILVAVVAVFSGVITRGGPSPIAEKAMLTPSLVLAY
jgi:hypothetical protein